jgi:hypothetical protein
MGRTDGRPSPNPRRSTHLPAKDEADGPIHDIVSLSLSFSVARTLAGFCFPLFVFDGQAVGSSFTGDVVTFFGHVKKEKKEKKNKTERKITK